MSFDTEAPTTDPAGCALLAAIATNPALLEPLEETINAGFQRLTADSDDPATALLVALAMDGMWLHRLVGSPLLNDATRETVRRRALSLLAGETTTPRQDAKV
jgi:hypothetical protein